MRWVIKLAIVSICFYGVARFCKRETGSFTVGRITSSLAPRPEWETPPLSIEEELAVKKILNQPFRYLSKGAQSFVFASEDGETVIKFFRHHHLAPAFWQRMSPKTVAKKKSKLMKDFSSYKLAYEMLRDETGLLYLHLNKTESLKQSLDLIDKLGIHHKIDLDRYEFVVQKRGTLVYPALEKMINEGRIDDAKTAIRGVVHFLASRSERGIFDKDPDLNSNFALIGTEVIQIDIGRFKRREPKLDKDEIVRITANLQQWLRIKSPELDTYLKTTIGEL